jgi:hypothetical protein
MIGNTFVSSGIPEIFEPGLLKAFEHAGRYYATLFVASEL